MASRVFWLLALGSFVWSCRQYWHGDKLGGDRLLFLAYCFMVSGYIALIRGWFPC